MTSSWISCFYLVPSFVCACFFDWLSVYLETYTHESSYVFNWYSKSLVITFYYFLDSLVVSKRHKLCFFIGITLPLNELVVLCDVSSLVCIVCEIHDMHYVPHILKDYSDALAHPCFSLLKCISMSHPSFLVWASLHLSLLSLVAQHLSVFKII